MFKRLTWHACQGHGVIITSKSPIPFLKEGDKCLQEAIPWGFHPYQEIVGTNVQILDLVHLLAPSELWDEAHQILRLLRPLSNLITSSVDTTILSMKGADLLVNGTPLHSVLLNASLH